MSPKSVLIAALLSVAAPALAAPPAAAPSKEAQADPQANRITGSPNYVPTFGLRATVARNYTVHAVLAVDAGLDVPSAKTRKRVEAIKPRLVSEMRDAVLSYANLSYTVGRPPDADMLRIRIQKAVDGVLGANEATVALASVIVFTN
jgi:hypothetical protein